MLATTAAAFTHTSCVGVGPSVRHGTLFALLRNPAIKARREFADSEIVASKPEAFRAFLAAERVRLARGWSRKRASKCSDAGSCEGRGSSNKWGFPLRPFAFFCVPRVSGRHFAGFFNSEFPPSAGVRTLYDGSLPYLS
jgi:hypothetical protein